MQVRMAPCGWMFDNPMNAKSIKNGVNVHDKCMAQR